MKIKTKIFWKDFMELIFIIFLMIIIPIIAFMIGAFIVGIILGMEIFK